MRPDSLHRGPEKLYECRLAWRAVQLVLECHGLAGISVRLNPDDPSQVIKTADALVLLSEDFRGRYSVSDAAAVVRVDLRRARARVVIERLGRLVRRNHLSEFDELGIGRAEDGPDVDAEVDLTEVIATEGELMRSAPPRVPAERNRPRRPLRVIRAFRGCLDDD